MKKPVFAKTLLIALLAVFVSPVILSAAAIKHHGQPADPENSYECMACHDGTTGKNVSFCTTNCSVATPHSVLVRYNAGNKKASLQPQALAVARGVRFVDGQVTCISCHDIRNPQKNHLIMDNSKSQLCLSCHIQ